MEALDMLFNHLSQYEVFMELVTGFIVGTAALRGVQAIAELGISLTESKKDDAWWAKKALPVLNSIYTISGFLNSWKIPKAE